MTSRTGLLLFVLTATASLSGTVRRAWADDADTRLRVFILAGQSNMEGKGAIKHLEQLLADPKTAAPFKHLRRDGQWVERDDVHISYLDRKGPLTVGYGTPTNRIGPELQFGHVVGDAIDAPVLIIKTSWGGRSVAVDFRPPSSGLGKFTRRDKKTKELVPLEAEQYGATYRDMIRIVYETLADLKSHDPRYDGKGFELSGFVFFQGFNDIINREFMAEYEANLTNLVRDVRKDLGVPNLPVVIGELGQQGVEPEKRYAEKHFRFRAMQAAVAKRKEFAGTVSYVPTSPYVIKEKPSFDGGYHYFGRADTFFYIGDAFGNSVLEMQDSKRVDHSAQVTRAWSDVHRQRFAK